MPGQEQNQTNYFNRIMFPGRKSATGFWPGGSACTAAAGHGKFLHDLCAEAVVVVCVEAIVEGMRTTTLRRAREERPQTTPLNRWAHPSNQFSPKPAPQANYKAFARLVTSYLNCLGPGLAES